MQCFSLVCHFIQKNISKGNRNIADRVGRDAICSTTSQTYECITLTAFFRTTSRPVLFIWIQNRIVKYLFDASPYFVLVPHFGWWSVRWAVGWEVLVWELAGSFCRVLGKDILFSQCTPSRREARYGCVFGTGACPVRLPANYQENLMKCWEVTLRWTDIPSRGE